MLCHAPSDPCQPPAIIHIEPKFNMDDVYVKTPVYNPVVFVQFYVEHSTRFGKRSSRCKKKRVPTTI